MSLNPLYNVEPLLIQSTIGIQSTERHRLNPLYNVEPLLMEKLVHGILAQKLLS